MQPLSKNIIKLIRSLEQRKFRRIEGEFVAEGNKLVGDNLGNLTCHRLIATRAWWEQHPEAETMAQECYVVTEAEMERVSLLNSPQEVMGTFLIPREEIAPAHLAEELRNQLTVALDEVQDPGNLGTIIRLCDWFGIRHIVCSPTTADCFAPKVVQATMGAIARVKAHYTPLPELFGEFRKQEVPIYGTFLEGTDIYHTDLTPHGVIVMGNEGRGISDEVRQWVDRKLFIPPYPANALTSESLNVGIATAICVSEFRRRL
ncbi:MAG: RNA methyltransferase [Bacteroidales bacterium]|nr:RNA methyltransferase [Bacteroidales bacterium]